MSKKKDFKDLKELNIDGTIYTTKLTKKFESRKKWEKPNPFLIKTYIPGTIVEINSEEGQIVEPDTPLLIQEAMKMRNQIVSHMNARIKKINVKVGDVLPKGHVMVELEPIPEELNA